MSGHWQHPAGHTLATRTMLMIQIFICIMIVSTHIKQSVLIYTEIDLGTVCPKFTHSFHLGI